MGNIPGAHANATDSDGDPIAFSLVSPDDGSGHALFAIDSAGQISLTAEARRSSITRRRRATR